MKKILSFVLVLAMVLGSVSMAFATNYPDVADTDDCAEAVNVLSALGVIEGYNDGTFKPEKTITRAEAIKIVVAALGIPVTEGNSYPSKFSDVAPTAWYAGYVNYGVAMGITEGTSADHFSPNATVTYDQVITFIMRALGYTDDLVGGYPTGYVVRAYQEGVLDKDMTAGTAPAPRGDIAQVLYNALDKAFVSYDKDLGDFKDNDDKYATDKPSMYYLLGATPEVDELTGKAIYNVVTIADINGAIADISDNLGALVQFIKNKDGKVVGIGEVKSVFADNATATKIGDYKLASDAKLLTENGGFKQFLNGDDATADYSVKTKASGKFAVILNSKNEVAQVVSYQKWDITEDDQITADDITEMNLANDEDIKGHEILDVPFAADEDDETKIDFSSFILEGVKSLADIEEGNIVYVYANKDGKVAKIQVGTEVVEGKLSAINTTSGKYTIAGTKYDRLNAATADEDLLTKDVEAYLDIDGKIYVLQAPKESKPNYVYGVILATDAKSESEWNETTENNRLKVFTIDGEEAIFSLKKGVTLPAITTPRSLVKLSVDEKNVVTKIEDGEALPSGTAISANGVITGNEYVVNANTKVIVLADTDTKNAAKAKSYEVVSYKEVLKQKDISGSVIATADKAEVLFITNGVSETSKTYAIFTDCEKIGTDKYNVTSADGTVYTYTAELKTAAPTTGAAKIFVLDVDDSKAIADQEEKAMTAHDAIVKKSTSPSENVIKLVTAVDETTKEETYDLIELDKDAVVFIYTASTKKWSTGTFSSLVGLKAESVVYTYSEKADGIVNAVVVLK